MSKRSAWCDFDKATKKYIKKRDKESCVICDKKVPTQIMHIFISRAHGGKGTKENGCCGCNKCHQIMDNPIGKDQFFKSLEYKEKCKEYLILKEGIIVNDEFMKSLKFDKKAIIQMDFNIQNINQEIKRSSITNDHCKDCKFLVRNKFSNSTIPTYYCKVKRKIVGKKNQACKEFKEK